MPYKSKSDGWLALLAQGQIFFSLLASIALSFSPAEYGSAAGSMDVLLTMLLFSPVAFGILQPLISQLLERFSEEEKVLCTARSAHFGAATWNRLTRRRRHPTITRPVPRCGVCCVPGGAPSADGRGNRVCRWP